MKGYRTFNYLATGLKVTFICTLLLLVTGEVHAQRRPGKINKKSLFSRSSAFDGAYDFNLSSTLDDIIHDSSNTDIYDPLTIAQLQILKEEAQPTRDPRDYDPYKTRRVVEKAFAIQAGRTVGRMLDRSELQGAYRSTKRMLKSIQDTFRYSVQTDGDSLKVSRNHRGRKLLELNMEFNLKQGMDPQIRIGQSFRFRYDYVQDRQMLEYGINF